MKIRILLGMLAASLWLIGLPAVAQPAPTNSDCFTILDPSDGPAGGTPLCVAEGIEGASEGGIHLLPGGFANAAAFGNPTLVYEPDPITLSDIFGVIVTATGPCSHGCIAFASDPSASDVASFYPPPDDDEFASLIVWETANGGTFDATAYLDATHRGNGFTASFFSDGDGSAAVPEPATLALLGLGVLAMGFARRKSLRTTPR